MLRYLTMRSQESSTRPPAWQHNHRWTLVNRGDGLHGHISGVQRHLVRWPLFRHPQRTHNFVDGFTTSLEKHISTRLLPCCDVHGAAHATAGFLRHFHSSGRQDGAAASADVPAVVP